MRDIALSSAQTASEIEAEAPRLNRRQAAKVRTRQKVLDAARTLFAERGYEPATIRDIAKGAGMSTGAVFANFQDKAELFEAVLAEDTARLADSLNAAVAAESTLRGRLLAALTAAYHAQLEHLPLVQAVVARSWFQPVAAEMRSRAALRPVTGVISDVLQTGVRENELHQDADIRLLSELVYVAYVGNYRHAAYDGWGIEQLTAHLGWIVAASQAILSEQILSKWFRLEWLRSRFERTFDDVFRLFQTRPALAQFNAHALESLATYETAKASAAITLSSKIFDELNPSVSAEWEKIKVALKI